MGVEQRDSLTVLARDPKAKLDGLAGRISAPPEGGR